MKTKLLSILVALPIFLITNNTFAQTTLAAGDIAIFQNQADAPDDFAFVTFVDIAAGTGIYFTDCGTSATGFRTPACVEGATKYTVPAAGLSAGDIVRFNLNSSDFSAYTDSRITGGFALATSGDQVVAFQDATSASGGTNAGNTPTFLFIIHNSATDFQGDPTDTNESLVPPGLSDTGSPRTALAVGLASGTGNGSEWDNTVYNGTYDFSGFATEAQAIAAAKIAMTDPANYTKSDDITSAPYTTNVAAIPSALNIMVLSNEEFLNNSFTVYPNPSNGNITIRNSGVALQNVTITDLNGRTMGTYEMNGVTGNTDLSLNLNTGMYFMQLTSNDASTTKKLIIK